MRTRQVTLENPDIALRLLWALNAKRLVGQRITRRMYELDEMTVEDLSQRTGLSVKTISRLRGGRSMPRRDTAQRLAAALELPLEELRPPATPEEDQDIHDQLHEVLSRLSRIEAAVGVNGDVSDEEDGADAAVRIAEEATASEPPDATRQQTG